MRRFFAYALIACCALIAPAVAQQTAVGNGSSPCTWYPMRAVGNGIDQCAASESIYAKALTVPGSTFSTNANNILQSRDGSVLIGDPFISTNALLCWPALISSAIQPWCANYNFSSGMISGAAQISSLGNTSNAHEKPGGGWIPGTADYLLYHDSYSSTSTAPCLSSTGAAGSSYTCQYANIGSQVGGGVAFTDISAAGSQIALPTLRTSEPLGIAWGEPCPSSIGSGFQPYLAIGGQQQYNGGNTSSWTNSVAGAFSWVTLHPVCSSGTTLSNLFVDTMDGSGGVLQTYDALTNSVTSARAATEEVSYPIHDDVALEVTISAESAGTGGLNLTLPAEGAFAGCSGATYSYTVGAGDTTATVASALANAFNAGSFSGCSGATTYWTATINASGQGCTANACIDFALKTGDPGSTSPSPYPAASGTGTVTASGSAVALAQTGAYHVGMQWGRFFLVNHSGLVALVLANMVFSGTSSSSPSPNAYTMNYSLLTSYGPVNGVWTFYDNTIGADGNSVTISPSSTLTNLFGGGSDNGNNCSPADCSGTITEYTSATSSSNIPWYIRNATPANRPSGMAPFVFDYRKSVTPSSSVSAWGGGPDAFLAIGLNKKDGDWDFAYVCGDGSSHLQLCWARISSTAAGTTLGQGYIVSTFPDADAFPTFVSLQELADGQVSVIWASGRGVNSGCANSGTCVRQSLSADNTLTGTWSTSSLYSSTGSSTDAGVCLGGVDESLWHDTLMCLPGAQTAGSGTLQAFDFFNF